MNVFPFKVDANLVPAILQTRTLSLMLLCSLSRVAIDGATFSRLELRMNFCVSWDKQFSSGTEVCFWCPNVSFIQKQTFYVISKHYLLISAFSSLTPYASVMGFQICPYHALLPLPSPMSHHLLSFFARRAKCSQSLTVVALPTCCHSSLSDVCVGDGVFNREAFVP